MVMAHSSTGVLEQRTYTEGHTVTGEVSLPPSRDGTAHAIAESEATPGREKSECRSSSQDAGELAQRTQSSEGRHRNKEPQERKMGKTPSLQTISTKRLRIAQAAKQYPDSGFNTLAHNIDIEWLREAYNRTRKDGAPGIDGLTAQEYEQNLEANLQSLLDRFKSGTYQAPAVRRVHIPKGTDGKQTRPLGIPTIEDKVLQRAVVMLLEPIYEQDFLDCSYGFRPDRSAQQALDAVWEATMKLRGGWVVEVDIRKFFDTIPHGTLLDTVRRRVRDGVLLRIIGKWLNAGVMEDGCVKRSEAGTPQGGVISPLLANVYLHEVVDKWFHTEVLPRLVGQAKLIRYADDMVMVFEVQSDAERVFKVLPKRFGRYGLALHPDKTKLLKFSRPPWCQPKTKRSPGHPQSFDFLGFTHYWGRSRRGAPVVKQCMSKSRLSRVLHQIRAWCRANRHERLAKLMPSLGQKLRGVYGYFGRIGNIQVLANIFYETQLALRKWLSRRSQKGKVKWKRLKEYLKRYPLPRPQITRGTSMQQTLVLTSRMRETCTSGSVGAPGG